MIIIRGVIFTRESKKNFTLGERRWFVLIGIAGITWSYLHPGVGLQRWFLDNKKATDSFPMAQQSKPLWKHYLPYSTVIFRRSSLLFPFEQGQRQHAVRIFCFNSIVIVSFRQGKVSFEAWIIELFPLMAAPPEVLIFFLLKRWVGFCRHWCWNLIFPNRERPGWSENCHRVLQHWLRGWRG